MAKTKKRLRLGFFSGLTVLLLLAFLVNFIYQITLKPSEIASLVAWSKKKTPTSTWKEYSAAFDEYSTSIMTPDFLAALAQLESGGDPMATPKWRFSFNKPLAHIYRPASTAAGLYQFTAGTFDWARKFCVENGQALDVPCSFSDMFHRLVPHHSIALASAYLHFQVQRISSWSGRREFSKSWKHRLAGVIHLCGVNKARRLYRRNELENLSGVYCGTHNLERYLRRLAKYQKTFKRLSRYN